MSVGIKMLCDRKSWQVFLDTAKMLAEAFSQCPACFTDVDGGATAEQRRQEMAYTKPDDLQVNASLMLKEHWGPCRVLSREM